MKDKKTKTPMEKLTQGYDKFIDGKQLANDGKNIFEAAIKKATKIKPRGLK